MALWHGAKVGLPPELAPATALASCQVLGSAQRRTFRIADRSEELTAGSSLVSLGCQHVAGATTGQGCDDGTLALSHPCWCLKDS